MDHLPSHEPTLIGMFSHFIFGICMSVMWQSVTKESLHLAGTLVSALLVALIVYMANNFWFPKWFPKNGKWKFFNWLKP